MPKLEYLRWYLGEKASNENDFLTKLYRMFHGTETSCIPKISIDVPDIFMTVSFLNVDDIREEVLESRGNGLYNFSLCILDIVRMRTDSPELKKMYEN